MRIAITGVSKGLGQAMAKGFAAEGHTVLGCARSEEALTSLRETLGHPHQFERCDVSVGEEVDQWASSVLANGDAPDFLINCAATMNRSAPLWSLGDEEFSDIVDINIKGVFHTIRRFVPAMIERRRGVIVNFSSYWGRCTSSDVAAYCSTKWAIEGLSRGLADDLPGGLASIALNPGVIHTEMLKSCFGASAASYPAPEVWAKSAVPFILHFDAVDNGSSVTVPGF